MRLPALAAALLTVGLSLPGCDQAEDTAPPAKAPQGQRAEPGAPAQPAARPTASRVRPTGGPTFMAPAPEVTEAELASWWRVMQPLLEGDQETFKTEQAAVSNWTELEIKVGRALIQYSAMKQAGVDPSMSGVVRTRYDKYLALSRQYQSQK